MECERLKELFIAGPLWCKVSNREENYKNGNIGFFFTVEI